MFASKNAADAVTEPYSGVRRSGFPRVSLSGGPKAPDLNRPTARPLIFLI